MINLNYRELATVLASLRAIQNVQQHEALDASIMDIATDGGTLEPLNDDEVDALCERLNTAPSQTRITISDVSPDDYAEAACCVWEAMVDLQNLNGDIDAAFKLHGASEMRCFAMKLARPCHLDWKALSDAGQYDEPFDWEFVPSWIIRKVDWEALDVKP